MDLLNNFITQKSYTPTSRGAPAGHRRNRRAGRQGRGVGVAGAKLSHAGLAPPRRGLRGSGTWERRAPRKAQCHANLSSFLLQNPGSTCQRSSNTWTRDGEISLSPRRLPCLDVTSEKLLFPECTLVRSLNQDGTGTGRLPGVLALFLGPKQHE